MDTFSTALGWSILHSLWFGFFIYIFTLCSFYLLPKLSASAKSYFPLIGSFALFCFFVSVFVNGLFAKDVGIPQALPEDMLYYSAIFLESVESRFFIEPYFPFIMGVYVIGVLIEGTRLVSGYFRLSRIKSKGLSSVPGAWKSLFDELTTKMGLARQVTFRISSFVKVPVMIGYFKPIVLFPIAAVNRLNPDEVEAILIHELTHIKRNDYAFNFLKVFFETMLFFNPFVWLLGNLIEKGREYACDDSVIKFNITPRTYATALLHLETSRNNDQRSLGMAAFYSKSDLFNRIKRMTTMKTNYVSLHQKMIALSVGVIGVVAIAWTGPATTSQEEYTEIVDSVYLPSDSVPVFTPEIETEPEESSVQPRLSAPESKILLGMPADEKKLTPKQRIVAQKFGELLRSYHAARHHNLNTPEYNAFLRQQEEAIQSYQAKHQYLNEMMIIHYSEQRAQDDSIRVKELEKMSSAEREAGLERDSLSRVLLTNLLEKLRSISPEQQALIQEQRDSIRVTIQERHGKLSPAERRAIEEQTQKLRELLTQQLLRAVTERQKP